MFICRGYGGYQTALPPVPEDAAGRTARQLAVEEKKKKKKKNEAKRAVHDAIEKHCRAHEREGLPLEASPSTDDEEEGRRYG